MDGIDTLKARYLAAVAGAAACAVLVAASAATRARTIFMQAPPDTLPDIGNTMVITASARLVKCCRLPAVARLSRVAAAVR